MPGDASIAQRRQRQKTNKKTVCGSRAIGIIDGVFAETLTTLLIVQYNITVGMK